ncbi:unnamed protein product [Durusdinium trenchii]|uniref:non-specific serine/threonine protein kinase n=1 Tax=Durusdinium trenchii TaxID=1381693 RepID=A0ABP0QWB9_9DINO
MLQAKGVKLTQMPLVELGLADAMPSAPGRGQRWGFGRHLAAAVCAMVLAEDLEQLSDLAPCCSLGAKAPEFLEALFVPLAACVIPLRKSIERLNERFGDRLLALLQSKASQVFAFALQLPFVTFGCAHPVDVDSIATAFREVAPQVEWVDTSRFVSKHFRDLLYLLDPVIRAWSPHLPQTTVILLRSLIGWAGPLNGSRLRVALAMLLQHSEMPPKQRIELSRVVAKAISAAGHSTGGLMKLVKHRDETITLILSRVEHEWSTAAPAAIRGESGPAERSPALSALLAVLSALKFGESPASGVVWLQLHLEAILPRLVPEAQRLVASAAHLELPEERSAKRLRRTATARLGMEAALRQLAPLPSDLTWGPPSSPDLGCIVRCFPETKSDEAGEEVIYTSLRLLAQGSPEQLRSDPPLARALALGLASLKPAANKAQSVICQDVVEASLGTHRVDELLYSVALLGATHLQAHPLASVRQMSGRALRHLMAAQKQLCQSARQALSKLLCTGHLAIEDLDELSSLQASSLGAAHPNGTISAPTGKISWQFTRSESDISLWMSGLFAHLLKLGSVVWDSAGIALLSACAPLAKHATDAAWFSERLLVLLLVKAATMAKSANSLAKDLTVFFQQRSPDHAQARCLLRALHLIRVHQSNLQGRAVPHFPADLQDPFWSSMDLFAAANCAANISNPEYAFLLLELHLQKCKPDLPLEEALEFLGGGGGMQGVEALFQPPLQEVRLLHDLARQLPDDELLYGKGDWCHTSSRLARADLAQDNLTSIHLRNELLEFALQQKNAEAEKEAHHGLDVAIARLGWHSLLTSSVLEPEDNEAWEQRAEALWRMRQWGPIEGMKHQSFHSSIHTALSGLSSAVQAVDSACTAGCLLSPSASHDFSLAVAALERPLLKMVATSVGEIQLQSPESLQLKAVHLQMLGSIFHCADALVMDVHKKTQVQGQSRGVATLASSWQNVKPSEAAMHFVHVEPLFALQASILATAAHPLPECRFLTALAGLAREAGWTHRALLLLERAQRATSNAKLTRQDNLMLRWEQARCLYELKSSEALSIAKAVAADCRGDLAGGCGGNAWAAQVLSCTGLWLSQSRLESADVIQKEYFEAAVALDPTGNHAGRQFADFLDSRLSEELTRQGSAAHARTIRTRKLTEANIARVQSEIDALSRRRTLTAQTQEEIRNLNEQKRKLEISKEEDQRSVQSEKERLKALTTGCIRQLGRCLSTGSEGLTQVACRFLSLWFDYSSEYPEITPIIKEATPKLSLTPVMPFIYQLASRLEMKDTHFQRTLDELLLRLSQKGSPALWPLILLRNGDQVPRGGSTSFKADISKVQAAKRVIEKIRKVPSVRPVLEAVDVLSAFYLAIAFYPVDKKNPASRDMNIKLGQIPEYRDVAKALQSSKVPVPTAAFDCSVPNIKHFVDGISIAKQGISFPKVVKLVDLEGREYKQLVKGGDDLRQDAVMQQLFRLLNDVFKENAKSSAQLHLRTFQVVPLSPQAGIVEWVANTITVGEILVGPTGNPEAGAHYRYRPNDWCHGTCRKKLADVKDMADSCKLQTLKEIYQNSKPVMHLVFLQRFWSPQEWHRARQAYARSTAVSSIVGYIVGLGDRHPNNILFDVRTGELIHIDFGIAFEAGRLLKVAEQVPFRLTRDIVAGLGCLGTCGLFRRCAETAMAQLRSNAPLVKAVVEVFVHDPIYSWSCMTPKNVQKEAGEAAGHSGQWAGELLSEEEGNDFARRAVLTVKEKLVGGSGHLGVPAHVRGLIHEAIDLQNLCRMFHGWQQWV